MTRRSCWCQLFSEPGAGSDLAGLTTRAVRDESSGGWRLSGQKVWTSYAQFADWGLCLARTTPVADAVPKQRGITAFAVAMTDPGVDVRPLRQATGDAEFNEVFLDDVLVPDAHVVGRVDDGWRVSGSTLSHERGTNPRQLVIHAQLLEELLRLALDRGALDDPRLRRRVAQGYVEVRIFQLHNWRSLSRLAAGEEVGPEGSALEAVLVGDEPAAPRDGDGGARPGGTADRTVAAVVAVLPVVVDLRRDERDPAQRDRRARPGAAPVTRPLDGVRVLDLGTRIAAPFCAGLLGELGADVIKVEQPGRGDFLRELGPFVATEESASGAVGHSLYWAVEGRGRRSVTLDLGKPEGAGLLRRLAATADVVCENFRPGTLERWGIGPGDCDPSLVWVRISTYGQDGPYSPRPGLDRVGIGFGGLMHLTGEPDRPPVRVGVTISDYLTGTMAANAAIAALYARDASGTGEGAVVDAALYGSVLRVLEWTLAAYDRLGVVRGREGNRLANSAPLDNYPTADGKWVCVVAGSDANFARLCEAMERPELATDPGWATVAARVAKVDEVNELVAAWTRSLTAAEVVDRCVAHDVPVATAHTAADIFADAHVAARGDLVTVEDPVIGATRQQAPFPRFVGEPVVAPAGAPLLGAHTREVLGSLLGLDDDALDRLAAEGIT